MINVTIVDFIDGVETFNDLATFDFGSKKLPVASFRRLSTAAFQVYSTSFRVNVKKFEAHRGSFMNDITALGKKGVNDFVTTM